MKCIYSSTSFHANPVQLIGIRERPPAPVHVALKHKFGDDNIPWPPIRPRRALRDMKTDEGTNLFAMIKAIPVTVAPDNTYT